MIFAFMRATRDFVKKFTPTRAKKEEQAPERDLSKAHRRFRNAGAFPVASLGGMLRGPGVNAADPGEHHKPALKFGRFCTKMVAMRILHTPNSTAGNGDHKHFDACTIVIFGASGDLAARKLVPALYHLFKDRQMPPSFRVVGLARREKTVASWRQELRAALEQFSRTKPVDDKVWNTFAENIFYCQGDLTDDAAYKKIETQLTDFGSGPLRENLLFYLAIPPSQFSVVVEQLHRAGLLNLEGAAWQRIVVEKPFGHDLASAQALNRDLTRYAHESQVFRIDHYLGKETVQNILMFRFSNSIFEQLWNRESVDHVQITVGEKLGVGERGGY